MKVSVCGAGGMIGGHLVRKLLWDGHEVRATDIKPLHEWHQVFSEADNLSRDLRGLEACLMAINNNTDQVYNLAADMGGIGFIEGNKASCMLSVLINTNLLRAALQLGVKKYFFSSSACVYAADKQELYWGAPLKEEDAYPAMPEDGYGWEKLFSERMCRHFREDYGLETIVARYHNVYGPNGTYKGGREKAPAAICRKVIEAKLSGNHEIEIWGDGSQTRSFMWIDDCIKGTQLLMDYGAAVPVNLGSSESVSVRQLVNMVEDIAGIHLKRTYKFDAPKGVNGRNSDNRLIKQLLNWKPSTKLRDGMEKLYAWVYNEMTKQ
jgi:GDP-D-mannose 3',5'-epimerase